MPNFRILFNDPRGVNVDAETEDEAKQIVKDREWEYGMDWSESEVEIISCEER